MVLAARSETRTEPLPEMRNAHRWVAAYPKSAPATTAGPLSARADSAKAQAVAMNRRHFLGSLAALSAGMALDPDKLLWVPGRKTYFDIVRPTSLEAASGTFIWNPNQFTAFEIERVLADHQDGLFYYPGPKYVPAFQYAPVFVSA